MSLSWFAAAVAGLTLVLMTMGGIVHNTRSSLICPDWPGCNGELLPPVTNTSVVLEHYTHRMVGMTIGILSIILAVGLFRRARRTGDRGLTPLGIVGVVAVTAVGMLGRHTVLGRLVPWASTAKLALATAVFALFVYIAMRAHPSEATRRTLSDKMQRATLIAALLVYVQMVLGAAMRHWGAGLACVELPLCAGGIIPSNHHPLVFLHQGHRLFAVAIAFVVAWAGRVAYQETQGFARLLAALGPVLVVVQIGLGLLSITTFLDVVPVTLHLDIAVAIFTSMFALHILGRGALSKATP